MTGCGVETRSLKILKKKFLVFSFAAFNVRVYFLTPSTVYRKMRHVIKLKKLARQEVEPPICCLIHSPTLDRLATQLKATDSGQNDS